MWRPLMRKRMLMLGSTKPHLLLSAALLVGLLLCSCFRGRYNTPPPPHPAIEPHHENKQLSIPKPPADSLSNRAATGGLGPAVQKPRFLLPASTKNRGHQLGYGPAVQCYRQAGWLGRDVKRQSHNSNPHSPSPVLTGTGVSRGFLPGGLSDALPTVICRVMTRCA